MYTFPEHSSKGRPLRSRCITSSLYVPEAVKMLPEMVTCDIIASGRIWDRLTFQSDAVSEPNRLPEAFWMLALCELHREDRCFEVIPSLASITASRDFMISWDSHQNPGMKLPNPNHVDTSWPRVSRTSCSLQPGWQGSRISWCSGFNSVRSGVRIRELLQVFVATIRHPGGRFLLRQLSVI